MRISNLQDLFAEQLKDLYNSEDQIQDAYSQWREQIESKELREMVDRHLQESNQRKSSLDDICRELDISPKGEKCEGTEGIIEEGQHLLEDLSDGPIRDAALIATMQRLEHYGIAGYGCARTYALQLDHDDAAERLQTALDHAAEIDEKMTQLAEEVLNPQAAQA